ncbi:hypothetical protein [Variovorax boronicumulans]
MACCVRPSAKTKTSASVEWGEHSGTPRDPADAVELALARLKLALQLNIENLFDKKYYSNIDGQAYFGTPRNAVATLSYAF